MHLLLMMPQKPTKGMHHHDNAGAENAAILPSWHPERAMVTRRRSEPNAYNRVAIGPGITVEPRVWDGREWRDRPG